MMKIGGKSIAVETHGEGEAIVMVHGLGGTSNTWHAQAGILARTHRVIRLDLEGSGRSPVRGKVSMATFARDVTTLMDKLEVKSAHLVGHSMGTIVCQHIAVNTPARVKSLALLGPLAEPPEPARGAIRDRAKLARDQGMVPIADTLVQVAISAETRSHQLAVAALVREMIMRQDAEGYARTCEALASAKSADLSKIKCPTLLITGDEDGVAPPANVRKLNAAIKKSTMQVLTGCGHWQPIEKPAATNTALLNFYFS